MLRYLLISVVSIGLLSCGDSQLDSDTLEKETAERAELPDGFELVDDKNELESAYFMKSFNEFCAANMPRIDKVKSASRLFEWEQLPDDMKVLLSPEDPSVPFDSWFIRDGQIPLMIGVTEPVWEGRQTQACTLAADIDGKTLEFHAKKSFPKAVQTVSETQHGQRYQVWKSQDYIYTLIDASPSEMTGATLSMLSIRKD